MSEIEERQQAPIMVLISSCGLDYMYAYPQSAGGLVACRSVYELMPPVIAVVGTRLVPPPAMGMPSSSSYVEKTRSDTLIRVSLQLLLSGFGLHALLAVFHRKLF